MGVYRLLLATLVVFFHFGGLSWVVGRVAVFGFYCVSGFVIFQVLDHAYAEEARGVWRFYANRLVRLAPLYIVYAVATLVMVRASGPVGPLYPGSGTPLLDDMDQAGGALLGNALTFSPRLDVVGFMPVLRFTPLLIPQGWSIGVELMCYLLAPIVVLTTRRRPRRLSLWIALGLAAFFWGVWTAGLDYDRFQSIVYKNVFTSLVAFLAGGAFYYLGRRVGRPVPFTAVGVLMVMWMATLTVGALRLGEGPSARVFTEYIWLTIALTGLVATTRVVRLRHVDQALGNLCYGVYLNHFLVAGLFLSVASPSVARPGTLFFGTVVLAGSLALAFVTYRVVERPFDRIRARIRGMATPGATSAPCLPVRARVVIAAITTALVVLTKPAGSAASFASQSGAGVLASSPVFSVRWRPDVSASDRLRIEDELGLVNLGQVERDVRQRTWTYRLESPTIQALRTARAHKSVEDTSLDAAQLELLRQ